MAVRPMVPIDEDKCDGCGLCVPGCTEGALQIVDGKAKLVSDIYCDGLGACLGSCPQDAIPLEDREADEFNEDAVNEHLKNLGRDPLPHGHDHADTGTEKIASAEGKVEDLACGCPGTLSQSFDRPVPITPAAVPKLGGCPGSQSQSFDQGKTSAPADQAQPEPP